MSIYRRFWCVLSQWWQRRQVYRRARQPMELYHRGLLTRWEWDREFLAARRPLGYRWLLRRLEPYRRQEHK